MARRHQRPLIVIVPQIPVRLLQPKPAIVAHDPVSGPQNRGVAAIRVCRKGHMPAVGPH